MGDYLLSPFTPGFLRAPVPGNPFLAFYRHMDRLFADLGHANLWPAPTNNAQAGMLLAPHMDVSETDTRMRLQTKLPSLADKDIEVNPSDEVLTFCAEKRKVFADLRTLPPPQAGSVDLVAEFRNQLLQVSRAEIAHMTLGLSPAALARAGLDWAAHLAAAPGQHFWLAWKVARKILRYGGFRIRRAFADNTPSFEPLAQEAWAARSQASPAPTVPVRHWRYWRCRATGARLCDDAALLQAAWTGLVVTGLDDVAMDERAPGRLRGSPT